MPYLKLLLAVLILALVSLACGININAPDIKLPDVHIPLQTGATQTEEIKVPNPDVKTADLNLKFGAGILNVKPQAAGDLVDGTATYNIEQLKPKIIRNAGEVTVQTGNMDVVGIPNFSKEYKNTWDLKLGDQPMRLDISAGAYQGDFELGGLSLQSLEVGDGAANVKLRFSEPNKTEMETLTYETGASNINLSGLANANFKAMTFHSGAGNSTLDFSGTLKRDGVVTIESGVSNIVVVVPEGTSAVVNFKGGFSNVRTSGAWSGSNDRFELAGKGPQLLITVQMGAGSLELRTR